MENSDNIPEEENQSWRDSEDPVVYFRGLLMSGAVDEAVKWENECQLSREDIQPHIIDAFNIHKLKHNYPLALTLGRQFGLHPSELDPLYMAEWNQLCERKQYEEAAQWADEQGIGEFEMKRAAYLAYERYLNLGKIEDAIRMITVYRLKHEDLIGKTIPAFNKAIKKEEFYFAALLGREFNFSARRTFLAAVNAMIKELVGGNFDKAVEIQYKFALVSEAVFEEIGDKESAEFVKKLLELYVLPAFEKGNLQTLRRFTLDTELLDKQPIHEQLITLQKEFISTAIRSHNASLKANDAKSAKFIRNSFKLFSLGSGHKYFISLIDSAFKYHNELLRNGNLDEALEVKEDCMLFTRYGLEEAVETAKKEAAAFVVTALEKGDYKSAKIAVNQYQIEPYIVEESLFKSIYNLMNRARYKEAAAVLIDFDLGIRTDELKDRFIAVYRKILDAHEYFLAADFAGSIGIGKQYIEDAAYRAWESMFLKEKYDVALEIRKKYRLPKKRTLKLAEKAYWNFMDKKDYDMAVYIRRSYRIPLTLTQWLIEILKIIFKK